MKFSEKIKDLIKRLRIKHKLTFINDSNYHEKWSFRLSSLNLITLVVLYTIIIVVIVMIFFAFTTLNAFINSSQNEASERLLEENERSLDSLYRMTRSTEKYLADLSTLLKDESFNDTVYQLKQDTSFLNYVPNFSRSKEDSLLRIKMEKQNSPDGMDDSEQNFDFFFSPVNGKVSQSFNPKKNHFGVDVVTAVDEPIKACLDGAVVLSGWLPGEGNIIIIQHNNDLISVYKHCSVLLKKQGDHILTGDPIGIVGNTGENTSGPHLHFEIWKKGIPLNPQEFISF